MRYEPVSTRKLLSTDTVIMEMPWRIQYPRQGRGANPEGWVPTIIWSNPPKKVKMKVIGPRGGARPWRPLPPPSANEMVLCESTMIKSMALQRTNTETKP